MISKIDDGGPAFPQFEVVAGERDGHGDIIDAYTVAKGGMSLRDYFAGKIAAGMASSSGTMGLAFGSSEIASRAYEIAEAMIVARKAGSAR